MRLLFNFYEPIVMMFCTDIRFKLLSFLILPLINLGGFFKAVE